MDRDRHGAGLELGADRVMAGLLPDRRALEAEDNCLEKAPGLLDGLDGLTRWTKRIVSRPSFTATAP